MTRLAERTVTAFLEELGSSSPAPGGGSAAALAAALGAALFAMTCRLGRSRNNAPEEKAALDRRSQRLEELVGALRDAIDEDARSFDSVMEALRLPKGGEEEKKVRSAAIQAAYRGAARVPLTAAGLSAEALSIGSVIASAVNPNALSDVGTGAALLGAAFDGASLNVRINLGVIKDPSFVAEASARLEQHRQKADEARRTIEAFLAAEGLPLDMGSSRSG